MCHRQIQYQMGSSGSFQLVLGQLSLPQIHRAAAPQAHLVALYTAVYWMNLLQIGKLRKMSLGNTVDGSGSVNKMVNSERSRRKTMTLQLPLAALSAANVVDAKYDSDSDFDYRHKPSRLACFTT